MKLGLPKHEGGVLPPQLQYFNMKVKHMNLWYLRTADTLAAIMKSVRSVSRSHVEPRTSTKTRYRKVLKIKGHMSYTINCTQYTQYYYHICFDDQ